MSKNKKIKKIKGGLNIDYVNLLKDLKNFNNLKTLKELKELKIVNEEDFLIDEDGKIIIDYISQEPIKYENAFLLENDIFDVYGGLYKWVVVLKNRKHPISRENISPENYQKINLFKILKILNSSSPNNLKSLEELKQFKAVDDEDYLIDETNERSIDPISKTPLKYQEAILINEYIYNIDDLFQYVFVTNKNFYLKKGFKKNIISIDNLIKIYNLKNNINPTTDTYSTQFCENSQQVLKNCEMIKTSLDNYDELIEQTYDLVLSISYIDIPRIVASIYYTNTLIFIFNNLKEKILLMYIDFDLNQRQLREKIFSNILKILEKIRDISYYNFEMILKYFSANEEFFQQIIKEIMKIVNKSNGISRIILDIQVQIVELLNQPLSTIYPVILKEYLNILKNYLKSQENITKIYRFCNIFFLNVLEDNSKNDFSRFMTKLLELSKNIEKQHNKSKRAFERASNAYKEYKTNFFEKAKKRLSKLFPSRRISNYNSPIFSPSISIPSP